MAKFSSAENQQQVGRQSQSRKSIGQLPLGRCLHQGVGQRLVRVGRPFMRIVGIGAKPLPGS